jgi:hypothetical protein
MMINVAKRVREKEILTGMIECEREGLDSVSKLIKSLEKKSERESRF